MNRSILAATAAVGVVGVSIIGAIAIGAFDFGSEPGATDRVAAGSPSRAPSPTLSATPTTTPTTTRSPTTKPTPRPTPITVPAPLTGRPVSPRDAEQHPIAVMIDDSPRARPQSGFNAASIVWQAPAEGGVPRYMLVFQETVPIDLGPVRSARPYFIAWAAEWNAVYGHVGGSPQAMATLRAEGKGQLVFDADEFRWGGTYYRRIKLRSSPHNVYSDAKSLRVMATRVGAVNGPIEPGWQFAPDAPLGARPTGGTIRVVYPQNTVVYDYDRATNTYLRGVTGAKEQIDAADGGRVAPGNVVIMLVSFGPLNDGSDAKRLEARVVGSGKAWIATSGRTIEGTWEKATLTDPTRFLDAAGRPVILTIGQTFIQVMPLGSSITIEDGSLPAASPVASPNSSGSPSPAASPSPS